MKLHRSAWRSVRFTVLGAATLALACLTLVAQTGTPAKPGTPAQPRTAAQTARPPADSVAGRPLKVLFLGQDEQTPHNPVRVFPLLAAPLARRGIQLTYVSTPADALAAAKLGYYDAIMLFGNHETITPQQEKALLDYVEGGRGLIALHSASAEFPGSEKYISLIGGQFQRHGTGEFTAEIVQPSHPITQGMKPFLTWDETYVHTKHNPVDRTVLMERVDAQGREPWTWVRTQGKGRVFYTAYGHDERTWGKPEFQTLVERAVAWAVDDSARRSWQQMEIPPITYVDGFNVPNYEQRDPAPRYQLPFTPPDAAKFIQASAEFDVKLFASEPDIIKPITMTFDERGRLWVIEAMDYPNEVLNGNPGDDRIKILEDTNGDGRADKFTVFAENLNLPTSLAFANGGVIVAGQPHFLFLKDTNGDDKADSRQVLSTGWGIRDTHAGPSNLQYAPDNHIWGVVGYSGFDGTMNGKPMQFTQGPYRFKPDGSDFEYLTTSTNNTWGLGFSETFDVFGSTANNDQSWYMAIPNRYFTGIEGLPSAGRAAGPGYQSAAAFYGVHPTTPYIRQVDVFGGYTAAAGHYLYTARSFPKEYWNRIAFITEPTAHLVGQAIIEKDGAAFVTRDGWNLLSSAEEWFAPIAAMTGPDGAVWVTDWYNFIAQHNPTPVGFSVGRGAAYETSMRDKLRGRIYRVVYKGAPAAKKRSLSKADPAGLLEALGSDNMLWRLHAQRLIVERGRKDIVPQLIAMTRNRSVDEIGTNGGALHALWTLHGLGELNSSTTAAYSAAVDALKHPAAGVRKAAAMVLPAAASTAGQTGQPVLAAALLQDPDLHTRLAAVLAVAELPTSPEIGQALYAASQKPDNYGDKWLSRALYIAANRHQKTFTAAYRADPKALPYSGLPVSLRLGTTKPDWRAPSAVELASEWKDMKVPGNWEANGLPDFDGVVWFSRALDWTEAAAPSSVSLGPIRNNAEVWVNGLLLTPAPFAPPAPAPAVGGGRGAGPGGAAPAPPAGGGRGNASATFVLPSGTLRSGKNTITVRIQNPRNEGGFIGTPESMFIQAGETRTPLAGTWKYRVERQTNAGALYTTPGQLAAHVAFTAEGGLAGAAGAALPPVAPPAPDVVIRLSVIPNQMKFDTSELTVAPGQLVEIVFTNPDVMQHNFVLGASGSLTQIGQAADQLATSPAGLTQQYVPDIPQVVFSTRLLEPGQTVTFQFRAPAAAGQYPYVCTFPSHWQVMNGVLNVLMPAGGRGRGGRGGL